MHELPLALLLIFGFVGAFLPLAGLYEYVLCPLWDRLRDRGDRA